MAPFNGSSLEMKAVAQYLRDHGLFAATRWNTIAAVPPLIISEDELARAYDIVDAALDLADKGVRLIVCTTCLNHYEIFDDLKVGEAGGMKDIVEAQWAADKVITI